LGKGDGFPLMKVFIEKSSQKSQATPTPPLKGRKGIKNALQVLGRLGAAKGATRPVPCPP
jgi:hypothetical protein